MYLLFDIGGTNLRVASSFEGKTIRDVKTSLTPDNFDQGIKMIKQMSDEIFGEKKIEAAGGCASLVFNRQKSMGISTSHLHGWINKPLKETLEKIFKAPVELENDAACFALGEATFGAGIGKEVVVFITVSTGLGGARVVKGNIDDNALGFEPGHQIIEIGGKSCHCGGKGHLEAYVSGWYLEKEYGIEASGITNPRVWDKVERYLSVGLSNTIVHWSPEIVILGGSVMKSLSVDKIKQYLIKDLTIFSKIPELVMAKLGDKGGLYGSLSLAKSARF